MIKQNLIHICFLGQLKLLFKGDDYSARKKIVKVAPWGNLNSFSLGDMIVF